MKRIAISLLFLLLVCNMFAQVPQSFKYQSVVRAADGTLIASQTVAFRISILQGSSSGPQVYVETFSVPTNQFGLATFNIGQGTPVIGNFTTINWSSDSYWVKVEIDPLNGDAFTDVGTSQLLSVPYSMHSGTSNKATELELKLQNLPSTVVAGGMITDIDGNSYSTVKIGTQVWMAENLKTTRYSNGELIGTTTPATLDISAESTPKYQWAAGGNEANVPIYGRLYTWYAATDSRNVCPTGWHVPTDAEMSTLATYAGGNSVAGGKIKATGTRLWVAPNPATNDYGFTAVPAGNRSIAGVFGNVGLTCQIWNSTSYSESIAYNRGLDNSTTNWYSGTANKKMGFNIRCIKDPTDGTYQGGITLSTSISNLNASGIVASGTIGVNTTGIGAALYLAPDGNYMEANAGSSSTMPCVALALETGTGNKKLLLHGYIRNDNWTFTPGGLVYVSSTAGNLTQTKPASTGQQVQIIGYAVNSNTLFFNPNLMLIELK